MSVYLEFQKSNIQTISTIKSPSKILVKHYQKNNCKAIAVVVAPNLNCLIVNYLSFSKTEEMPLLCINVNDDEGLPVYENSLIFGCKKTQLHELPNEINATAFDILACSINMNEIENIFMHSYISFEYMNVVQNFLRHKQKDGYS